MQKHVFAAVLVSLGLACSSSDDTGSTPSVVVIGPSAAGGAASGNGGASAGTAGGVTAGTGGVSGSSGHAGGQSPGMGGAAGTTAGTTAGTSAGASGGTGGAAGQAGSANSGGAGAGGDGTAGMSSSGGIGGATCAGVTLAPTLSFQLDSAPYPSTSHPSVAVHVPSGFRPCDHPGAIVFFHGFDNCVENVIGAVDSPCEPGGPARSALHLADQLDAAHVNAMLIAVQLAYDQSTGDPGALTKPGSLATLLHELLADHMSPLFGMPFDLDSLERVVLASHSGGYWATAVVLDGGMVPQITEVDLFDSLYGYQSTFEGWMKQNIASFDGALPRPFRFVDVYTTGGGTLDNSQSMAADETTVLGGAGLSASLLDDATTATLADTDFAHPVIFKHSALAHNDVPRYYMQKLVPQSGFTPL